MTNSFSEGAPSVLEEVFGALAAAENTLSRLDAKLGGSPLLKGWRARVAYEEAAAWLWNTGERISVAELVLHDAGLDQHAPDPFVASAGASLRRRRRASRLPTSELLDWSGVERLLGRRQRSAAARSAADVQLLAAVAASRSTRPAGSALGAESSFPLPFLDLMQIPDLRLDQDEDVFAYWARPSARLLRWPPLMRAVARLDLWAALQPLARETDVGGMIVEAQLREDGRLLVSPLLVERGRRALGTRGRIWSARASACDRTVYWLDAIAQGARFGIGELDALSIARQRLDRLLLGRRANSRLPQVADLFLASPVVTPALIARTLAISQQAARTMIGDLDGVVREVTGRRSFRAWRI